MFPWDFATTTDIEKLKKQLSEVQAHVKTFQAAQPYMAWARLMAEEWATMQDLDNNGVVFGHDFFIAGLNFEEFPSIMQPAMRDITKRIETGRWVGIVVPVEMFLKEIADPRDRAAITRIFGLTDERNSH